jgi:hypothetical protein
MRVSRMARRRKRGPLTSPPNAKPYAPVKEGRIPDMSMRIDRQAKDPLSEQQYKLGDGLELNLYAPGSTTTQELG